MSRVDELRKQRNELATELAVLTVDRDAAFRRNSDAQSRERAGVTEQVSQDMPQLALDETEADAKMSELRREIHRLDGEIESEPKAGLGSRIAGAFRRES